MAASGTSATTRLCSGNCRPSTHAKYSLARAGGPPNGPPTKCTSMAGRLAESPGAMRQAALRLSILALPPEARPMTDVYTNESRGGQPFLALPRPSLYHSGPGCRMQVSGSSRKGPICHTAAVALARRCSLHRIETGAIFLRGAIARASCAWPTPCSRDSDPSASFSTRRYRPSQTSGGSKAGLTVATGRAMVTQAAIWDGSARHVRRPLHSVPETPFSRRNCRMAGG